MAAPMVQVSPGVSMRVRLLREGRGWTIAEAATRAGLAAAVWETFEQGAEVPADVYRAVIALFGFTPHAMAFLEKAGKQGATPSTTTR